MWHISCAVKKPNAVTAYLKSEQLLLFVIADHNNDSPLNVDQNGVLMLSQRLCPTQEQLLVLAE